MKGVLLINLGTPDSPKRWDVYRYLKQFLMDERVIDVHPILRTILVKGIIAPFRSGSSAKGYQLLWTENGSPLKYYGNRLRELLQKELGADYHVVLGMRYMNPSIEVALDEFVQQKIDDILVIPLYPHYATSSTGSVNVEIMRALAKRWNTPAIKFIHSFYDYPPFIKAWIERASEYDWRAYDHVLFSYHGLPQRHIRKSDSCNHCFKEGCCDAVSAENKNCYAAHCHETTRLIVAELGIPKEKYSLSYQSRLGNDPWMPPYTSDVIKELAEAGKKRVLVFCPAFVSDCLETTVEISNEYQEEFEKYGGEKLELVKSLNDHPAWVGALKELVLENR